MKVRSINRNSRNTRLILAAVAAVSASQLLDSKASATTYYWDSDASATGNDVSGTSLGGAGTWNQTATNKVWWVDGATSDVAWGAGTTDSAIFTGSANTVTLGATLPAGVAGLKFDTTGYTIAGSTLTLSGGDINVGGTYVTPLTATLNSGTLAQGANTINKTGQGKLVLGSLGASTSAAGSGAIVKCRGWRLNIKRRVSIHP